MQRYVDGDLNPTEEATARAHLADCALCRCYVEGLQQTEALLRRMTRPAVPPEFARQVMARLQGQVATYLWAEPGGRWFAWVTGLAGLVVLTLTLAEILTGIPSASAWVTIADWLDKALQGPETALSALGGMLAHTWQGVLVLGETALPLGLAMLALGGFIQMLRWLTWWGLQQERQGWDVRYS